MLLETMGRDDVEELEVPFIEDKVVSTLNSINVDKAPSPDGFTMVFWQQYWDFCEAQGDRHFQGFL